VALTAREEPFLYYIRNFYVLLIAATISGMALHNGLDFIRKLRREYRRWGGGAATQDAGEFNSDARGPQRWILRMSIAERWQHGMLAVSFLVLVYTGFALKFPDTWLFAWFVALEKGHAIRSWVHRCAAVVMVLACLWHLASRICRRAAADRSCSRCCHASKMSWKRSRTWDTPWACGPSRRASTASVTLKRPSTGR
jgi:hypothetical protein